MTIEIEKPDLKRTVTAGDSNPNPNSIGAFNLYPFYFGTGPWQNTLLPELPQYWSAERDRVLAGTLDRSGFWAAAVATACDQAAGKAWNLEGKMPRQIASFQDLFHGANAGEGFDHFLLQHLQDYFCTDNGAFVEIARATDSPAGKITGLFHLDSLRCRRTGNPETPVMYYNIYSGQWHYLKWYQVFSISDMPNARTNWFGVGHCAAARAYVHIRKMEASEKYVYEKMTGNGPQSIHFLTGITPEQLDGLLKESEAKRIAKGYQVYGGAAVVAMMMREAISHTEVKVVDLPEKFDPKEELNQALLLFANSLGIDPQDLQPLASSNLGTATQSQVLDEKAKGRGLPLWQKRWAYFVNNWILPNSTRWTWVEKDLRDQKQRADIFAVWATAAAALLDKGAISPQQAMQKLVDEDQLPNEFLPQDLTPQVSLADTEKPEMELSMDDEGGQPPALPATQPAPPKPGLAQYVLEKYGTKEAGDAGKLVAQEEAKARKIYEEIISGRATA